MLADYPFLDVVWSMLVFFLWVAWFWLLFSIWGISSAAETSPDGARPVG